MRDKKLAARFRGSPCIICGAPGNGDHILNYKGWKSRDVEKNMWSLCFSHHREKTDFEWGLYGFATKYNLFDELESRGFELNEPMLKFYHKEF